MTPAKAIGRNMRLSRVSAGIVLKTFLAHKCLPCVFALNQLKTYASMFSVIRNAIQLATVIRGTVPNIVAHMSCAVQNGAGVSCMLNQKKNTIATCVMKAMRIILWVSFLPNLSFTISVKRYVTEKSRTPLGPYSVVNPRSKAEIFTASSCAVSVNVTYKAMRRSGFCTFLAYTLPRSVKLVMPIIQMNIRKNDMDEDISITYLFGDVKYCVLIEIVPI